jgi:hypothetical protein
LAISNGDEELFIDEDNNPTIQPDIEESMRKFTLGLLLLLFLAPLAAPANAQVVIAVGHRHHRHYHHYRHHRYDRR